MKKLVCIAFLFLCACASFGRGVVEGVMEESKKATSPKECMIWSAGFNGLVDSQNAVTKVLLVHGVGMHTPGHSTPFMMDITHLMGMNEGTRDYKQIIMRDKNGDFVGVLRIYKFTNPVTQKRLIFYEQTWAGITRPFKEKLAYDTNEEFSANRADVNGLIKKYANETLPDPMIYLGPDGLKMLESSVQAFCWMTSNGYENLPDRADEMCHFKPKQALASLKRDNYAFITSSLGSRMVMDALQTVGTTLKASQTQAVDLTAALALIQNKEIPIFMLANQLPLLQMGRTLPAHRGMWKEFCTPGGKNYKDRLFKKLELVAFSDPNDILSYAIEPDSVDQYLDSKLCPTITNVSITTTKAVNLFGFGQVANPLLAHKSYAADPLVLQMIVFGLHKKEQSTLIQKDCRWIQFEGPSS